MRFLIDMPLAPGLVRWLGARGHDAVHAGMIGLSRASDTEIIAQVLSDDRVVITADLDYPRLLALFGGDRAEPHPLSRRRLG